MGEKSMEINERTKIGLYSIMLAIPTIVVGLYWVFGVAFKAEAATLKNVEQDAKIDSQTLILVQIRDNIKDLESEIKLMRRARNTNPRED